MRCSRRSCNRSRTWIGVSFACPCMTGLYSSFVRPGAKIIHSVRKVWTAPESLVEEPVLSRAWLQQPYPWSLYIFRSCELGRRKTFLPYLDQQPCTSCARWHGSHSLFTRTRQRGNLIQKTDLSDNGQPWIRSPTRCCLQITSFENLQGHVLWRVPEGTHIHALAQPRASLCLPWVARRQQNHGQK